MSHNPEINLDGLDCAQEVVLKPKHEGKASVFITIGDASVWIVTRDDRLEISVTAHGFEEHDPLEKLDVCLRSVTAHKVECEKLVLLESKVIAEVERIRSDEDGGVRLTLEEVFKMAEDNVLKQEANAKPNPEGPQ